MLTPNTFSKRSAISAVTEALPLTTSDSVARRTPRISAAPVTVKPKALMISTARLSFVFSYEPRFAENVALHGGEELLVRSAGP